MWSSKMSIIFLKVYYFLVFVARVNATFESERAKLLAEVQELTGSKRHLEETIKTMTESERHKTHVIKTLEDKMKTQCEKVKKEADIQAKRLVRSFCIVNHYFVLFEHTCAYARWAYMHRFLSVHLSVCHLTKIQTRK